MRRPIALLAVALVACSTDLGPAHRTAARDPVDQREPDEIVLDLAPDGDALVGRALPVPEQSDADRVLAIRWLTRSGPRAWRFDGAHVLEAHFVPRTNAVLVLTTEHTLLRVDRPDAPGAEIDRSVAGPLSLDQAGRWVVYTRGEMPEFEVIRADIATGTTVALAPGLVPAWSPVISPDGLTVMVVASPEGTPEFHRLREGAAPERWEVPANTPLPTGPSAPLWVNDTLVYESDGALYTLGLDAVMLANRPGLGLPVCASGPAGVVAQDPTNTLTPLTPGELPEPR